MFRRFITLFGYVGALIAVAVFTVILVYYGRGYTYNFANGKLIQTGLVIIQSSPLASVAVDAKPSKKSTPYRSSFEAGSYTFTLTKDGFHTWTKTLRVVASEVTNAMGVVLVPLAPQANRLDTRSQIVAQSISRDHKRLLYVTSGLDAGIYTLDIGASKSQKIYSPAAATATQPAEMVTGAVWSFDASHVLVTATLAGAPVYRVISSSGGSELNLTQQYGFNFSGIAFSDYSWKQLYWISPDGLRKLDLDTQSVSGVLADKVSQFNMAGDRVLFVQSTTYGRSLVSLDSRGRRQQLIQALPDSPTYAIAVSNYHGQDQLAIVPSSTRVGSLYSAIYSQNPVSRIVAHDVSDVSFSPDGHLATFFSQAGLQTYDLELSDIESTNVIYNSPAYAGAITGLAWFDNYHLLLNRSGRLQWADFDGTNAIDLGEIITLGTAYGSSDATTVVALRPDGSGVKIESILIKP